MEKIKIYTFHSNGNDVICKNMNAERVNEHILYVSEDEVYSNWSVTYHYLIVDYNGIFVKLDRTNNLEFITNLTFDTILNNFNQRVENNLYFNKVDLMLCKAISVELYEKALSARNHVLAQREEEERERREKIRKETQEEEQRKQQEKAQKLKEREEKREHDEQFFKENSDILKSDLSSFERITAKRELTKPYNWIFFETKTSEICSILTLIRKHNYSTIHSITEKYTKDGDLRKTPKTYYYLNTSGKSLGFQIPAKLGKLLTLKNE